MRTIGLIGGIGSGKTTVARFLQELGAHVLHADAVGHEVYAPGQPGWQAVRDAFGGGVVGVDGAIDRKKLGAIVFADAAQLKRLNAILHPRIGEKISQRIARLREDGFTRPIVVEAAILVEAGWLPLVDEVWLVSASPELVIERLAAERGLSADDVRRRIDAQTSDAERRRHARVVIENKGSVGELRDQVEAAWKQLPADER